MTGYIQISLNDMIEQLGEDETKSILSSFNSIMNADVENFLKHKAIEFSKQGLAKTHLVFTAYKNKHELIGYFTLAPKILIINRNSLSETLQKRIKKFATYNKELHHYILSAPLIAQLGKNYNNELNKLITGDELLKMACDKIKMVQGEIGGKVVYLECDDNERLLDFYLSNGFAKFGKRLLEKDEADINGTYLIQMLKYL